MLQSLLALPLGVVAEVLVFLFLYRVTPMKGRQVAVVIAMLSLAALIVYSLLDWPGADVLAMYFSVFLVTAYLLGVVSSSREQYQNDAEQSKRWFHWGPAIIVMFFVALFTLNSVLVVVSKQGLPHAIADRLLPKQNQPENISSAFPGVVARNFQKKEALYNDYLKQVERQQQRGWQVSKGWLGKPYAGHPETFQVRVSERDDAPVAFASVSGIFQRASDSQLDQPFQLKEVEPGLYRARIVLPAPGRWRLIMQIRRGDQLHEVHADTSVKPVDAKP